MEEANKRVQDEEEEESDIFLRDDSDDEKFDDEDQESESDSEDDDEKRKQVKEEDPDLCLLNYKDMIRLSIMNENGVGFGEIFEKPYKLVRFSSTIKDSIKFDILNQQYGNSTEIKRSNLQLDVVELNKFIRMPIFELIFEWVDNHLEDKALPKTETNEQRRLRRSDFSDYDKEYLEKNGKDMYEILNAADYLGVAGLVDLICQHLAFNIIVRSGERVKEERKTNNLSEEEENEIRRDEIRRMFNIAYDFTPEQEEEMRKENILFNKLPKQPPYLREQFTSRN